ncbi:MAG: hypothetical protein JWQ23_4559 [Herminiimonas sp.]|nr:hypothetical protein [Herminiimonas sp.]
MSFRSRTLGFLFVCCMGLLPLMSHAAWPDKPIKIVIGVPPGGVTDTMARILGKELSDVLATPVIIENKTGAGGMLAMTAAAAAEPNGYTVLLDGVTTRVISMNFYANATTDLQRGFEPVALIANAPHVLLVSESSPAKTLPELISLAKSKSGPLSFASQGNGTLSHLEGELFAQQLDVQLLHVPYRGSGPAQVDLISGQVAFMFDSVAAAKPQVRAGKLRALGVATQKRLPALDAPTLQEAGLSGYQANNWFGMFAPKGTPSGIVNALSQALRKVMDNPAIKSQLGDLGVSLEHGAPAELATTVASEKKMWDALVARGNLVQPEARK